LNLVRARRTRDFEDFVIVFRHLVSI
jgi:hypothetical protein